MPACQSRTEQQQAEAAQGARDGGDVGRRRGVRQGWRRRRCRRGAARRDATAATMRSRRRCQATAASSKDEQAKERRVRSGVRLIQSVKEDLGRGKCVSLDCPGEEKQKEIRKKGEK